MSTTARQDREFSALVKEQIGLTADEFIDWVSSEFSPEEVFSLKDLAFWAEQNGYILPSECPESEEA